MWHPVGDVSLGLCLCVHLRYILELLLFQYTTFLPWRATKVLHKHGDMKTIVLKPQSNTNKLKCIKRTKPLVPKTETPVTPHVEEEQTC